MASPSPATIPSWAALQASCGGSPSTQEGLVIMQGSTNPVLADLKTNPWSPRAICSITGNWTPQLVTQRTISWSASQAGQSVIATLDLFSGTTGLVAGWTGGGFMDGLHAWSPDQGLLAYLTSDATAVNLHLLSGGGDRVVTTLGAVPGRGVNPAEDDSFLGFSADGQFFALVQTFTGSGDHLQVRRSRDGTLAYSQANGTMATWSNSGSRLYFRQTGSAVVNVWDPSTGVSQAFGQQLAWVRPRTDFGDDNLAFTVRDSSGIPHVWLYGHSGRSGGQLPGVRSTPTFLLSVLVFYVEEAPCGANCGPGPATQPDGHTFVYDTGSQHETVSTIAQVLGTSPRLGQV
jgi:hypothetical protein